MKRVNMIMRIAFGLLLLPWLALSARAADPAPDPAKLPKVLLIGDSISMGYTPVVQKLLQGVAVVSHPAGNCEYTGYGLENLKVWLGKGKWDVIHFNFGIWDTHLLNTKGEMVAKEEGPQPMPGTHLRYPPEKYYENLTKIVAILEKTGAKLIWASTTPVMTRTGKRFDDIPNNNAAAAAIRI